MQKICCSLLPKGLAFRAEGSTKKGSMENHQEVHELGETSVYRIASPVDPQANPDQTVPSRVWMEVQRFLRRPVGNARPFHTHPKNHLQLDGRSHHVAGKGWEARRHRISCIDHLQAPSRCITLPFTLIGKETQPDHVRRRGRLEGSLDVHRTQIAFQDPGWNPMPQDELRNPINGMPWET